LIVDQAEWFGRLLTSQSQILTHIQGLDVVLVKHVNDAHDELLRPTGIDSVQPDVLLSASGIFGGIFVPLLIQELSREDGGRAGWVALFAILGTIGILILLIIFGSAFLRNRNRPSKVNRSVSE